MTRAPMALTQSHSRQDHTTGGSPSTGGFTRLDVSALLCSACMEVTVGHAEAAGRDKNSISFGHGRTRMASNAYLLGKNYQKRFRPMTRSPGLRCLTFLADAGDSRPPLRHRRKRKGGLEMVFASMKSACQGSSPQRRNVDDHFIGWATGIWQSLPAPGCSAVPKDLPITASGRLHCYQDGLSGFHTV